MESNQYEVLSRKAAAQFLNICTTSLDRCADLPRIKIGKRVLFRRVSLEKWLLKKEAANGG